MIRHRDFSGSAVVLHTIYGVLEYLEQALIRWSVSHDEITPLGRYPSRQILWP